MSSFHHIRPETPKLNLSHNSLQNIPYNSFQQLTGCIIEYLSYHGYVETIRQFEKETTKIINERPGSALQIVKSSNSAGGLITFNERKFIKEEMISSLEKGLSVNFLTLWERVVSAKLRASDQETIKLEFFIRLFFATYPLRNGNKKEHSKAVSQFKDYLDEKGTILSNTSELLPFYAFPYIPNPASHPSFRSIFQDKWKEELVKKFASRIDIIFEIPVQEPLIHSVLKLSEPSHRQSTLKNKVERKGFEDEVENQKPDTIQKEHNMELNHMQDRYSQLYRLCTDMFKALGGVAKGKKLNVDFLRCVRQKLESLKVESLRCKAPASSRPNSSGSDLSSNSSGQSKGLYAPLDFNLIKEDLLSVEDSKKPYLLQALRWRITKCKTKQETRKTIQGYCENDLFCLKRKFKSKVSPNFFNFSLKICFYETIQRIFSILIKSEYRPTVEYSIRLLNSFTIDKDGTSYATQNSESSHLLEDLVYALKKEKTETVIRRGVIGILSRISYHENNQRKLVGLGLIEILCVILGNGGDKCSDCISEKASTLLRNLCIGRDAIPRLENKNLDILGILTDLLEHPSSGVKSNVNESLLAILKNSAKIRMKAKEMGLEHLLEIYQQKCGEHFSKQVSMIFSVIHSENNPIHWENESNPLEIVEEEEFIEEETLPFKSNQMIGEELLCHKYLATDESVLTNDDQLKESVERSLNSIPGDLRFSFDYKHSNPNLSKRVMIPRMKKMNENESEVKTLNSDIEDIGSHQHNIDDDDDDDDDNNDDEDNYNDNDDNDDEDNDDDI